MNNKELADKIAEALDNNSDINPIEAIRTALNEHNKPTRILVTVSGGVMQGFDADGPVTPFLRDHDDMESLQDEEGNTPDNEKEAHEWEIAEHTAEEFDKLISAAGADL